METLEELNKKYRQAINDYENRAETGVTALQTIRILEKLRPRILEAKRHQK